MHRLIFSILYSDTLSNFIFLHISFISCASFFIVQSLSILVHGLLLADPNLNELYSILSPPLLSSPLIFSHLLSSHLRFISLSFTHIHSYGREKQHSLIRERRTTCTHTGGKNNLHFGSAVIPAEQTSFSRSYLGEPCVCMCVCVSVCGVCVCVCMCVCVLYLGKP